MANRSPCHRSPSIAVPSFGTRKATLRFRTSVPRHLSNSARSIMTVSAFNLADECSSLTTVFEDQVRGMVCYRDDRGEVICEGYDEGPRLGMRLLEKACFPWPMGIRVTDFIELSMLRVWENEDDLK
ncbi:hypothetical protein HU200_017159 [Digitaria exilis]|uniref:Uncharacterized protein n=1 Tax=Digitaria exilis TaxID=1010633 RepID=A0A835KHP3_9POAL|nr:hypothetical protein HU200_017159 [Digitaria exilis]